LTTLADDLDAFGADEVPDEEPMLAGGAEALDQADRFLRAIRRIERDRAELKAHADAERVRVDEWFRDRTAGMDDRLDYLRGMLDRLARAWKGRTGKNPPKLVNGALRLTAPRSHLEVVDPDAFEAWARANDRVDLLRVKVEPDKEAIRRSLKDGPVEAENDVERRQGVMTAEGQPVPGLVSVVAKDDSFSVTVA
jgi:Bacteriophage Mu Gam like protein